MKNVGPCFVCQCEVWIPDALYEACHASRGPKQQGGIQFFCGYGHAQHYVKGETEAQKLRRERDRLTQRLAEKDDEIARQRGLRVHTENQLRSTKGIVTRIKNRVGHGVCPCCNRSFGDLARHMTTKHPTYAAEAAE